MKIALTMMTIASVSTAALAGTRLSDRTRTARLLHEGADDAGAGGLALPSRVAAGSMKALASDYAGEIRRAKRTLARAADASRTALALSFRRARGAAVVSRR
jgi:hypothetical protein